MIKYLHTYLLIVSGFAGLNAQNLYIEFSKTEKECELAKASVTVITGAQPLQFLWSNGAVSDEVDGLEEGNYNVYVKDGQNNDTTIYFRVETLVCEPRPENHFTPNYDGYNDTWSISRLENFPDFELFVYNRWGQLVHSQQNQYIPWDGRSVTFPLPDATYYYILYLEKSNKKKFIKGDISIIR
ncbi:MAG: gliding motility-associated C-terminal domain-containing protein [Burkholderiales bacterium]|nr:gliding motility-associated C-terminal domain-containing protein [Bacteroidia bacterium]